MDPNAKRRRAYAVHREERRAQDRAQQAANKDRFRERQQARKQRLLEEKAERIPTSSIQVDRNITVPFD